MLDALIFIQGEYMYFVSPEIWGKKVLNLEVFPVGLKGSDFVYGKNKVIPSWKIKNNVHDFEDTAKSSFLLKSRAIKLYFQKRRNALISDIKTIKEHIVDDCSALFFEELNFNEVSDGQIVHIFNFRLDYKSEFLEKKEVPIEAVLKFNGDVYKNFYQLKNGRELKKTIYPKDKNHKYYRIFDNSDYAHIAFQQSLATNLKTLEDELSSVQTNIKLLNKAILKYSN